MEKRHNYAAAGFLLLGIGAAGRAFLGVPEGVDRKSTRLNSSH